MQEKRGRLLAEKRQILTGSGKWRKNLPRSQDSSWLRFPRKMWRVDSPSSQVLGRLIHDKYSVLRKESLNCLSMLQKGYLRGLQRIRIKYVQYQVATRPGRAEAEVVREGQERPSSSSPSVKRRSQDGVRAPQCSSMPKDSESISRHHNVWVARSTSQGGGMSFTDQISQINVWNGFH